MQYYLYDCSGTLIATDTDQQRLLDIAENAGLKEQGFEILPYEKKQQDPTDFGLTLQSIGLLY